MKKKIKLKRKITQSKLFNYIIFVVFLIILITSIIVKKFDQKVTPKIVKISKLKAEDVIYDVITNNVNRYVLNDSELLEKIIEVYQNDAGEIITADFNLENAYLLLRNVTKSIEENISLNEDDEGIYMEIPLGYFFNSSFFSNIGPRIPVKINFTGTILTNLKTKITNYGMNNALVELYANIVIVEEILTPITKEKIKTDYDVLLSSKLINGRVPSYYGGFYEKESKIFDVLNE